MPLEEADSPESPDWWLLRLGRELKARRPRLDRWWDYYRGEQPLPEGPRRATEAYKDFQKKARSNFCKEVVDSSVNRLRVIGITDAEGRPDDAAWSWWTKNRMQARQSVLWRATLALSEAYMMVGRRDGGRPPLITLEHPREVIVYADPGTGERLFALKAWYDDVRRRGRANVYTRTETIKYQTESTRGPGPLPWSAKGWTRLEGEEGGGPHNLPGVPVVPFSCRPFLGEDPVSEFDMVMDPQDRINLGVLNRMTAERYSAFRQKWVKGHRFRRTTDPETGLEIREQPFVPDPGAVWASTGENVQFGEFSQTQLGDYMRAHEADIRDLLTISRTPAYTYGDLVNISPDTIVALDVSHVAKVEEHQNNFAEGLSEVLDLAAAAADVEDRDYGASEVRWKNARLINPAVAADAAVKKKSIGYPLSILAEDMGESPTRVQRITSEAAADALMGASAIRLAADSTAQAQASVPAAGGDGSA